MASVSIITVLAGNEHLHFHDGNAPDSIALASEGVIAEHVDMRLRSVAGVRRFIVVAGDLSWSISVDQDQHLQYTESTGRYRVRS